MSFTYFSLTILGVYGAYYASIYLIDRMSAGRSLTATRSGAEYAIHPSQSVVAPPVRMSATVDKKDDGGTKDLHESNDELLELDDDIIPDDGIEVTERELSNYFKRNGNL